jgi:hypothetical protein
VRILITLDFWMSFREPIHRRHPNGTGEHPRKNPKDGMSFHNLGIYFSGRKRQAANA